jgi:hypothetical protein
MILVTIGEAMDVAERAPAETSISTRHHTVSRGGTGTVGDTLIPPPHFVKGSGEREQYSIYIPMSSLISAVQKAKRVFVN